MGGGSKVDEASAQFGLPVELLMEAENFKDKDLSGGIYPDNLLSVQVFHDMIRQWRVGMNGLYGLDYNVLPFIFNIRRVKRKKQFRIFEDIKVMEQAVIADVSK